MNKKYFQKDEVNSIGKKQLKEILRPIPIKEIQEKIPPQIFGRRRARESEGASLRNCRLAPSLIPKRYSSKAAKIS